MERTTQLVGGKMRKQISEFRLRCWSRQIYVCFLFDTLTQAQQRHTSQQQNVMRQTAFPTTNEKKMYNSLLNDEEKKKGKPGRVLNEDKANMMDTEERNGQQEDDKAAHGWGPCLAACRAAAAQWCGTNPS